MYPLWMLDEVKRLGRGLEYLWEGCQVVLVCIVCLAPAMALEYGVCELLVASQGDQAHWYTVVGFFVGTITVVGVGAATFFLARRYVLKSWFDDLRGGSNGQG